MNTSVKATAMGGLLLLSGGLSACNRSNTPAADELRKMVLSQQAQLLSEELNHQHSTEHQLKTSRFYDKVNGRAVDVKQLDQLSGPSTYQKLKVDYGTGLDGKRIQQVKITLKQAVHRAIKHNLDLRIASIQPSISEAEVVRSEAQFDATFFTDVSYTDADDPQQTSVFSTNRQSSSQTWALETGIQKRVETGGVFSISTGLDVVENRSGRVSPDPAYRPNINLTFEQPLLRNFGLEVNRAQIVFNENAWRRDVLSMHVQAMDLTAQIEQAYWNLALAQSELVIRTRLLDAARATRDLITERAGFNANAVNLAQANASVEQRKSIVVRARKAVYEASDQLKLLMDDPEFPVTGELLLVASDQALVSPVKYNLFESVQSALNRRPELRAALLNIDDASIRQMVADNQRLPELTLRFQTTFNGQDGYWAGSYDSMFEGDFVEYLVGLRLEVPIGNRDAEAFHHQARMQRMQSVLDYQRQARNLSLEVKTRVRDLVTDFQLLQQATDFRRAAAENLRALVERRKLQPQLTPEFLELILTTQSRLGDAEVNELQAAISYNVNMALYRRSLGNNLGHYAIDLSWPESAYRK